MPNLKPATTIKNKSLRASVLPTAKPSFYSVILQTGDDQDQSSAVITYILSRQDLLLDQHKPLTSTSSQLRFFNQDQQGIGIDQARQLINECSFSGYDQNTRLIVLLHAQQMSLPAQNALLKVIEEPPSNTLIILVTSQPQALLATIHSRCIMAKATLPPTELIGQSPAISSLTIESLFNQLTQSALSYSDIIEIAQTYKDRQLALALMAALLTHSLNQLSQPMSNQSLKKMLFFQQLLLKCHQGLSQNFNVTLTIENSFFQLFKAPK